MTVQGLPAGGRHGSGSAEQADQVSEAAGPEAVLILAVLQQGADRHLEGRSVEVVHADQDEASAQSRVSATPGGL